MESIEKEEIENLYKLIGKNVKKIRKKRKSQLDLALSVGHSSAGFVGKAEICIHNKHFNIEHLYKIANVLKVDMCEFLKPTEDF